MNKKKNASLLTPIYAFLAFLVGRVQWSSPPWFLYCRHQAATKPRVFAITILSVLLAFIAMGYGYYWYKHLPQPLRTTAVIKAPLGSHLEHEEWIADNLTIQFGLKDKAGHFTPQSVAPLNQVDKKVTTGISLSPAIEGTWAWLGDNQLVFTPTKDWPAGQTYNIQFSPSVFSQQTHMARLDYSFSTHPFEARVGEFKFYQDPLDAKRHRAVATLQFNFPVDPISLEQGVSLRFETLQNKKAASVPFTITYDKEKRAAYIQSEPLSLEKQARYLVLTLDKSIKSSTGSAKTAARLSKNIKIPARADYFKVNTAAATIVRDEQDKPSQVLVLETSLGMTQAAVKQALHVYVLPENYPATATSAEQKAYVWKNPGEVTPQILALSTPLNLQAIPADRNDATLHSFKFNIETPHYLYVKLDKGARGSGDFLLARDYDAVIQAPEFPKEISFLHKGALLALSGEQKLSVMVRGVAAVKFEFARVLPANVNQLVTQTQGDFNNPYFINTSFNQQNISQVFSEIQSFDATDLAKQQYVALDFQKYLSAASHTGGPQGLFLLKATGWDTEQQTEMDVKNSRLILMTNMGLVVKDNQDGSHDVFVQSITEGVPLAHVDVAVLGKNGLPLLTIGTNEQGQAHFPSLKDYSNEREPVVYLASFGDDVSFIPFHNDGRQLNYSRFDTGGIYTNNQEHALSAYLFSDRGIYRPGDAVHIGMIVKQGFVKAPPPGLVVDATVTDPRGMLVHEQKLTLDEWGYLSLDVPTTLTSATGQYSVDLYLVKDDKADSLLGSTTLRVADFQPDTMRIQTHLSKDNMQGWVSASDLKATVQLWNLYGTPAAHHRVGARLLLESREVHFKAYEDYQFVDPLVDPKKPAKVFTETLNDGQTDEKGVAQFNLNLERFDKATYQLTFFAEGFETEGGRSVSAQTSVLVSERPYFVGYKPDSDLNFIKQNSEHLVHLIAIDSQLKQQALNDLSLELVALQPVSSLVKNPNGTYQYQSIMQRKLLSTQAVSIDKQGSNFKVPTTTIGHFAVRVVDKNHTELSHFEFRVVGASQQSLAKNAELQVTLSRDEYKAGDEIELQISAPYTGSGLITIERDKVYAVQWFKSDTNNSVQKIHIPSDFEGNGYVNVAFVRDWNSPDIFMSPLSYSILPFSVTHDNRDIKIDLSVPVLAKPGESLVMNYHSDKPGKIIVFAVDEGILQAARYQTPDPLAYFFQDRALEVITQQTVDQILPQYRRDRELSAAGGDGGEENLAGLLNPFKRKTDLPVVYWSGILDTDSTPRQVSYDIPDYFNGSLRVMAVASAIDAVGAVNHTIPVRGDFVINPHLPTFVAPGDEFEVSASIANQVKGSGNNAAINVQLQVTPGLELIGQDSVTVTVAEGQEQSVRFKLRATTHLGSAKATWVAHLGDKSGQMHATLSVRPATLQFTTIQSGQSTKARQSLPLSRLLYPEYRQVDAAMSTSPLILVAGLQRYLDNFPYGCTEQLVSKVFPLLTLTEKPAFASSSTGADKITATIQMLGQRQMSNGAFSYWPTVGINEESSHFVAVYAMHFLTEAKAAGYEVPEHLLQGGLSYLRDFATQNTANSDMAREQAYAIYVLTRHEIVTTNDLTHLQLYLEKDSTGAWRHELTGAYIAATYQLLKNQAEAERLIADYTVATSSSVTNDFYDNDIANAQYLYLIARHFPERLAKVNDQLTLALVAAINSADINTILSSYVSLALHAVADAVPKAEQGQFSILEQDATHQQKTLATGTDIKTNVDETAKDIIFMNPDKQAYFYQLSQSGFDKTLATKALQQGIEVSREYYDKQGNPITSVALGDEVEVHIRTRALDNRYLSHIAIVDLLPGGFEVIRDSVKPDAFGYVDMREDRVIFFNGVDSNAQEIVYRIKAINIGHYTVPPIFAESMYDPAIKAYGTVSTMVVTAVQ